METKVYIANTPLVLQTAGGREFRVEAGEAVELSAEQYAQVAAHVTAGEIRADDLTGDETPADEMPSPSEDKSETAPEDGKPAPKRSRKPKTE